MQNLLNMQRWHCASLKSLFYIKYTECIAYTKENRNWRHFLVTFLFCNYYFNQYCISQLQEISLIMTVSLVERVNIALSYCMLRLNSMEIFTLLYLHEFEYWTVFPICLFALNVPTMQTLAVATLFSIIHTNCEWGRFLCCICVAAQVLNLLFFYFNPVSSFFSCLCIFIYRNRNSSWMFSSRWDIYNLQFASFHWLPMQPHHSNTPQQHYVRIIGQVVSLYNEIFLQANAAQNYRVTDLVCCNEKKMSPVSTLWWIKCIFVEYLAKL